MVNYSSQGPLALPDGRMDLPEETKPAEGCKCKLHPQIQPLALVHIPRHGQEPYHHHRVKENEGRAARITPGRPRITPHMSGPAFHDPAQARRGEASPRPARVWRRE
jgi:hypothetical protein